MQTVLKKIIQKFSMSPLKPRKTMMTLIICCLHLQSNTTTVKNPGTKIVQSVPQVPNSSKCLDFKTFLHHYSFHPCNDNSLILAKSCNKRDVKFSQNKCLAIPSGSIGCLIGNSEF